MLPPTVVQGIEVPRRAIGKMLSHVMRNMRVGDSFTIEAVHKSVIYDVGREYFIAYTSKIHEENGIELITVHKLPDDMLMAGEESPLDLRLKP